MLEVKKKDLEKELVEAKEKTEEGQLPAMIFIVLCIGVLIALRHLQKKHLNNAPHENLKLLYDNLVKSDKRFVSFPLFPDTTTEMVALSKKVFRELDEQR